MLSRSPSNTRCIAAALQASFLAPLLWALFHAARAIDRHGRQRRRAAGLAAAAPVAAAAPEPAAAEPARDARQRRGAEPSPAAVRAADARGRLAGEAPPHAAGIARRRGARRVARAPPHAPVATCRIAPTASLAAQPGLALGAGDAPEPRVIGPGDAA